jgi:hypothetical protein
MRKFFFFCCVLVLCGVSASFSWGATVHRHRARRASSLTRVHHRHSARIRRARLSRIRRVRLLRMALASPIHGTHESLVRQNMMVVGEDQLERIQDDAQLEELTRSQALTALPDDETIRVNPGLPLERRYCRPWTRSFLSSFAQDHYERFHRPLLVTSAVRTVAVQQQLRRWNGNAAGLEGDTASPHLTGAAVDIAKQGMTRAERKWAQQYLLDLQDQGKLDAEEEFLEPVFHVTVYKSFDPDSVPVASAPLPVATPASSLSTTRPDNGIEMPPSTSAPPDVIQQDGTADNSL